MNMISDMEHGYLPPEIDEDSRPFWEGLKQRKLLLPRCGSCLRLFFPPAPGCPHCGGAEAAFEEVEARGKLYSWTTVAVALHDAFATDGPYTVVSVDLNAGPRIFGRMMRSSTGKLRAGAPSLGSFYQVRDTVLLGFEID